MRARSTGGLLRSYELTYVYSGSEVQSEKNKFDLSDATMSEPTPDGWSINGLTEKAIDSAFVKAVLGVALDEEVPNPENKLP